MMFMLHVKALVVAVRVSSILYLICHRCRVGLVASMWYCIYVSQTLFSNAYSRSLLYAESIAS
jgi:hypothetical protein